MAIPVVDLIGWLQELHDRDPMATAGVGDGGIMLVKLGTGEQLSLAVGGVPTSQQTGDSLLESQCEELAKRAGWRSGGGYIYDGELFGSWKEAVSWCGDAGITDEERDSTVYDSWWDCCIGEELLTARQRAAGLASGRLY